MNARTILFTGLGLGAGLMYVLDPDRGRRRRALARDKIVSSTRRLDDALGARARDMANRARGLVAQARKLLSPADVSDAGLAEGTRSEMPDATPR